MTAILSMGRWLMSHDENWRGYIISLSYNYDGTKQYITYFVGYIVISSILHISFELERLNFMNLHELIIQIHETKSWRKWLYIHRVSWHMAQSPWLVL